MRDRIKWERRKEPAHVVTAGWVAYLDGEYLGSVWLDGSYTRHGAMRNVGSLALAAEAFVLQVERECGSCST